MVNIRAELSFNGSAGFILKRAFSFNFVIDLYRNKKIALFRVLLVDYYVVTGLTNMQSLRYFAHHCGFLTKSPVA